MRRKRVGRLLRKLLPVRGTNILLFDFETCEFGKDGSSMGLNIMKATKYGKKISNIRLFNAGR